MKRVLIVEDQPELRRFIRMILEYRKFAIVEAEDAGSAFALMNQTHPDIVLLDVVMEGPRSGLEVCARIKGDAALRSIPVVIVSALGEQVDRVEGYSAGADDYLVKPFGPLRLIETVERHLGHSWQDRQDSRLRGGGNQFSAESLGALDQTGSLRGNPTESLESSASGARS